MPEEETTEVAPEATGSESETTPAAETAPAMEAPAVETPSYMTRPQVEEIMGGLAEQFKGQFNGMQSELGKLTTMLNYMHKSSQQPTTQPKTFSIPDFNEFSQFQMHDVHNLLSQMYQHFDGSTKEFKDTIKKLSDNIRQERDQSRYWDYFTRHTENAMRQHDLFKDERFKKLLQYQVAARLNDCNGDVTKVDIPAVAKEIAELFTSRTAPPPPPATTTTGTVTTSTGSPSVPGVKDPGEMKSLTDWDNQSEAFLEELFNRKAEEADLE